MMNKKMHKIETIDQVHKISGLAKPMNLHVTIIYYSLANTSDAP